MAVVICASTPVIGMGNSDSDMTTLLPGILEKVHERHDHPVSAH